MKRRAYLISTFAAIAFTLALSACGEGSKSKSVGNPAVPPTCVPGTPGCVTPPPGPGGGAWNGYSRGYTGRMVITNNATYRQILEDWNICGTLWFGNILNYDCGSWDNQADVQLDIFGQQIPAQGRLTVHAVAEKYGLYSPFSYNGYAQPINNNTGFEIRAQGGYAGYNDTFSMQANVGNIISGTQAVQSFRVLLIYNGTQFGYSDLLLRW